MRYLQRSSLMIKDSVKNCCTVGNIFVKNVNFFQQKVQKYCLLMKNLASWVLTETVYPILYTHPAYKMIAYRNLLHGCANVLGTSA